MIQRSYRTTATQSKAKPILASVNVLFELLVREAERFSHGKYEAAYKEIRPLLTQFSLASILYREYRSGAIHEFAFEVDGRFFAESDLYVDTLRYTWDSTTYLEIRVPARWLIDACRTCVSSYQRRLMQTLRLPLPLFIELCNVPQDVGYLDDETVVDALELRPNLGR